MRHHLLLVVYPFLSVTYSQFYESQYLKSTFCKHHQIWRYPFSTNGKINIFFSSIHVHNNISVTSANWMIRDATFYEKVGFHIIHSFYVWLQSALWWRLCSGLISQSESLCSVKRPPDKLRMPSWAGGTDWPNELQRQDGLWKYFWTFQLSLSC